MPDPSKFEALETIGFYLAPTCATCTFWIQGRSIGDDLQASPVGSWGRCTKVAYEHNKHAGTQNPGTPSIGSCIEHQMHPRRILKLAGSYGHAFPAGRAANGH